MGTYNDPVTYKTNVDDYGSCISCTIPLNNHVAMHQLDSMRKKPMESAKIEANSHTASGLAKSLRDVLRSNEHKHTPYITLRKEVVLPLVDAIYELAKWQEKTGFKCTKCALYREAEDRRIAQATIDRLIKQAHSSTSPITPSEAENLDKIFRSNYTRKEYEDDR